MPTRLSVAVLATSLLAACASAPPPSAKRPTGAAPKTSAAAVPADDNLNAVVWSQLAVEHDLIYREVYRDAEERLLEALNDPSWDALPREDRTGPVVGLAPAVVVDVDETVLDTGGYQRYLIRSGREYDDSTWAQWCQKEAAKPLPGALEFARFAQSHGVTIFYLTNRAKDLEQVTLGNLRKVGFPVEKDSQFLGLGTNVPGCMQVGSDKGCRRQLIARRYRVLMMFGDQVGDFVDIVANTPAGRAKAVAPYLDWVGERWWVLPNPTYGSWEPAAFGNDWTQSRAERRRKKIEALGEH